MKVLLTILILVFGFPSLAQSKTETELAKTVSEFHEAMLKQDLDFINKHTDKALSYGHSNGWVQSKDDFVKDFKRGWISYQMFTVDSMSVEANDNLAQVRFLADVKATVNGKNNSFHISVLEVWLKKNKTWVMFARQGVK
jgi:hypothetical protein